MAITIIKDYSFSFAKNDDYVYLSSDKIDEQQFRYGLHFLYDERPCTLVNNQIKELCSQMMHEIMPGMGKQFESLMNDDNVGGMLDDIISSTCSAEDMKKNKVKYYSVGRPNIN